MEPTVNPAAPTPGEYEHRAYLRFLNRLIDIHDGDEVCQFCLVPVPCDTMRAVWIFDCETFQVGG